MTPHHRYTLPLEISLFEQNKHTIYGHLVIPYILVIKNFMTPQYIWDPPSEENASPLMPEQE